jgi:uncharacterized membrane protein (DUF4010 family)
MSRLSTGSLGTDTAAWAILIAAAVNTAAKVVMGWLAGGARPGVRLAMAALAGVGAGLGGAFLSDVPTPSLGSALG